MNLEDVIDNKYGLQQDEYSTSGVTFGEQGQIKLIGWSGRHKSKKWYIVKCESCARDSELYGEGIFRIFRSNLEKPAIPCGCSKRPKLTPDQYTIIAQRHAGEKMKILSYLGTRANNAYFKAECSMCKDDKELFPQGWEVYMSNLRQGRSLSCKCSVSPKLSAVQWEILCKRIASDRGLTFRRLGEWLGNNKTKVYINCILCEAEASITSIDRFKNSPDLCLYKCASCLSEHRTTQMVNQRNDPAFVANLVESSRLITTKSEEELIAIFISTGSYSEGTSFVKKDKDVCGSRACWEVYCPDCNSYASAHYGTLQKGCRPCACSNQRQQEAYINWVVGDSNNAVAIKFGIAVDTERRVKQQNYRSVYEVRNYLVYTFPDVESCKKAERECKKQLECGVLSKQDMPDGWTETTWTYNLARVKQIFENNGGVNETNM